jgi:hypothetical protein
VERGDHSTSPTKRGIARLVDAAQSLSKSRVMQHLENGAVKTVASAPVFHYPAYAVFPSTSDGQVLAIVLKTLRKTVTEQKKC